jgi:hypothetical protein
VVIAGLGVALFHVGLELTGKLECPAGLLGLGTAPKQSLATFTLVSALLLGDVLSAGRLRTGTWSALAGGVILGGLLAFASCTSNPPMPAPPTAYAAPPDVCRPPIKHPGAEP